MDQTNGSARVLRFGVFQADLQTGELHKHGVKVPLETRAIKETRAMFRVPEHRFLFCGGKFTSSSVGARSDGLQGYMQLASAENVQHAFQIVGGYGQADFRLRSPQSTQQEAWMSEDTVFQIGKWMFRGGSS